MGKTAFVLNIAQYMAFKKNYTAAIFSLEMSKEQLVNRLFALETRRFAMAAASSKLTFCPEQLVKAGNCRVQYSGDLSLSDSSS